MQHTFFRFCTALVALGLSATALADGLTELDKFLRSAQQGRADFTQTVLTPAKAGDARVRTRTSSGTFEFLRPDRFRIQYTKPFEQTIAADGQTLWVYDADLNQATARRQRDVLGSTPAALIASAADLKTLEKAFELRNATGEAGQDWVQAVPKAKEGQVQSVKIGMREGKLATLEILDSFGQRSVMSFGVLNTQTGFAPGHFAFRPPAGAEVVRE